MGLEIHFNGTFSPDRSAFGATLPETVEDWLQQLAETFAVETFRYEDESGEGEITWQVALHPAEEPLTITLEGAEISGYARTSNAGPGYHQYIVRALELAESRWGLHWDVDDDTEYWRRRDRDALERAMVDFMVSRNRIAYEALDEEGFGIALGMPEDVQPVNTGYDVVTPMGPRNRAWLEHVATGELPVARFEREFAWWNEELDAEFWTRYGLVHCYLNVIWQPTDSEDSLLAARQAFDAFDNALRLNPEADLPWPEWVRLAQLIGRDDEIERIRSAPFYSEHRPFFGGYRLGWLRHTLDGGWQMQLPGSWYSAYDPDDPNLRFVESEQSLFFSAFTHDGKEAPAISDELKSDRPEIEWEEGELHGTIAIENGDEGWLLQAIVTAENSIALATFWAPDPTNENALIRAARTISRSGSSDYSEYDTIEDE